MPRTPQRPSQPPPLPFASSRRGRYRWRWLVMMVALLPLVGYGYLLAQRPALIPVTDDIFQGVTYRREIRSTPRPIAIHILTVDLTTPGLKVMVSPGVTTDPDAPDFGAAIAQTTPEFMAAAGVQVAVNGSFFFPFHEATPWDYGPKSGDRVQALGQTIAAGQTYAQARPKWYPLCGLKTDMPPFVVLAAPAERPTCPPNTEFALSGYPRLVVDGQPAALDDVGIAGARSAYSRLMAAVDAAGTTLWLVAVDGKQPFYSEGMTLGELSQLAIELGAAIAVNFDGGGSTTIAAATPNGVKVLNAPMHTKLPGRVRPVVNHVGIFAPALPPSSP